MFGTLQTLNLTLNPEFIWSPQLNDPLLTYSYLIHQTLSAIGNEKNTTIIFPVPVDVMSAFFGDDKNDAKSKKRSKSPSPQKPEDEEDGANEAERGESLLRRRGRAAKRNKRGSLIESENVVVSPPRAFASSGYSLVNMMECVVDIDPYESTYL